MHIVYLLHAPYYLSGGTRVVYEQVNRLAENGHKVELWVSEKHGKVPFKNSVELRTLDESRLDEPDVIVMCDPAYSEMVRSKRSKGGVFLLLQHDTELITEGATKTAYVQIMNALKEDVEGGHCTIIVVSSWLQKQIQGHYGINSTVINNGVNTDLFHVSTPFIQTGNPTVLITYDPQSWKGAAHAISILLAAQAHIPDLEVLILSKGILSPPQDTGLTYTFPFPVTFFYNPPQDRMANIYASADVFLSTSQVEGFGLPVLEAFACGTPVMTTDNGGNREFALDNKTAIIIQADNITETATQLTDLLTNIELRSKLKRAALQMAKKYNWDESIIILENLFARSIA